MQSELDRDLIEAAGALHDGYSFIINNAGKAIALLTLTVAIILTFSDVTLASLSAAEFTGTLAIMLTSSYIIYFSLEDAGERLGERSDEYRSAMAKYRKAKEKIGSGSIRALREFCIRYSADELKYRREGFIAESGYTEEDFNDYKEGKNQSAHARRVFRKASNMKAVRLSPTILLSESRTSAKSELEDPRTRKIFTSFINLIPSTICMVLTVSVVFSAKGDLGIADVILGLVKLSALPLIGFRGYTSGYSYVKERKSVWIETKARLLDGFVSAEDKA